MRLLLIIFLVPLIFLASCSKEEEPVDIKNKTDETIEFYTAKIKLDPNSYNYHNSLAQAYIQKARETGDTTYYSKAGLTLQESLRTKPDNYEDLVLMSVVKGSEHNFKEALTYAKNASMLHPEKAYAYGVLGDAYLELGQLKNAEKAYIKMIKLKPGLDSYSRLSNLRFKKHDISGAIEAMEKAYEYGLKNARTPKENLAWTQAMLGNIYLHEGDEDRAEEHFHRALDIMPDFTLSRGFTGETHTHSF